MAHLEPSVLHVGAVLLVLTDNVSPGQGLSMLGSAAQSRIVDGGTKSREDKRPQLIRGILRVQDCTRGQGAYRGVSKIIGSGCRWLEKWLRGKFWCVQPG